MKLIITIFLLIGSIFSLIGFSIFLPNIDLMQNGELTNATIVDLNYSSDGMAAPIVSYNCLGKDYQNASSLYSSPPPRIGDKIEVYCSKNDPNKFVINSFIDLYFGLIFSSIGGILIIVGIGLLMYSIKRKKFIEYIKLNGKILEAPVTFIGFNKNINVNGKNPSIFELEYIDNFNNSIYTFRSDNIWFNVDQFIKLGDFVKVYVDENNYKKYWVDTSFLPEIK